MLRFLLDINKQPIIISIRMKYTIDIDAPVEVAFDHVSMFKLYVHGLDNVEGYESRVGCNFKQNLSYDPETWFSINGKVIAYEKPHLIGFKFWSNAMDSEVYFRFTRKGDKHCILDYSNNWVQKNRWAKWIGSLTSWYSNLFLKRQVRRFKEAAERGNRWE